MLKHCPICNTEHVDTLGACPSSHLPLPGAETNNDARLIGTVIKDRYQLTDMLGKGAMGAVYKATQLGEDKEIAIKVLHTHLASDPESIKRFQHEAKAASSLLHPHIVRLYDVGMMAGGQPYLAMEYLEGKTLAELIRDKRYFDTREALPIVRQVCDALAEAHSYGVLHRDIKPANIMLMNRFGQENFVVVLDFSISKVIQRVSDVDTTTPGLIFGSPAYMSPERFMGRGGDFRADIYSLGIIMFQMLAGRAPFKSSDLYKLMNDHVSTPPPRVRDIRPESDIPDLLEETIARALAKKPEDRHSNIKQLLSEINEIHSDLLNLTPSIQMPAISAFRNSAQHEAAVAQAPVQTPPTATTQAPSPSQRTPETSFSSAVQSAASNRPPSAVFGIDPGLTPPLALPAYNAQARKAMGLDESLQVKASDSANTAKWDKSLIVKSTGDRQRPAIRPPEQGNRLPLELIALIAVMLIGIGAIFATLMPTTNTTSSKIAGFIKADNLDAAAATLNAWHPNEKAQSEIDGYGESCLSLGRALMKKHDNDAAAVVFDMVPTGSKVLNEARAFARQCRKASNQADD